MKIWDNPFKRVSKKTCICGKETDTMKVNMTFLKRSIGAQIIVLPLLFVAIYLGGFSEVFAKAWWLIGLEAILLLIFLAKTADRLGQGHTLKCSMRRAAFSVL